MSRPTPAVLVAAALGAAALGGGYALGAAQGPDLATARAEGEAAGRSVDTADTRRDCYRKAFADGRREGYDRTYQRARDKAMNRVLTEGP